MRIGSVPASNSGLPPVLDRNRFSSFEEAISYCSEQGYENADIVHVVLEKTKIYRDGIRSRVTPIHLNVSMANSLCSILAATKGSEINVVDFGGACGAHYFTAREFLSREIQLNWVVVETPEMARRAGAALTSSELRFTSDLETAVRSLPRVDLVHTSGTLQCVDKPYQILDSLLAISAGHMLFSRLGMTRGEKEVITLHESYLSSNGPGPMPTGIADKKVRYPFVFPRESLFLRALLRDYDILATMEDPSGIFPMDNKPLLSLGLLARRR